MFGITLSCFIYTCIIQPGLCVRILMQLMYTKNVDSSVHKKKSSLKTHFIHLCCGLIATLGTLIFCNRNKYGC